MDPFLGWLGDITTKLPGLVWNAYAWLFLAPLLLLSKRLRAWVSTTTVAVGTHIGGALAHYLGKHIRHAFAAPISAYSYAHRALMDNATALLRVPLKQKGRALTTDDVFVPLALEGSGRRIFHSEVLAAGNRLRISGDPGSGKSTILKRLFRDECRRLRRRNTLWRAMLPVLIELRHVRAPRTDDDDRLAEALMAYVKRALTSVQDYRMDECLDAYLRKRGLLLLLDGADEIQSTDYPRIERAIIALSDQLARDSPNSQIVLTMRLQFETRLGRELREEFPTAFVVQRFTPSDIFQFLKNWPFVDDRDARVSRIYNGLVDRPNLREMCTNPLVLSMYAAEDEARNVADLQSFPSAAETRTEFYRDVVEELMVLRRASQIGHKEAPHLFRDRCYRVLGRIAYEQLSNADASANRISWASALAVVRDVLGQSKIGAKKAAVKVIGQDDEEALAYLDDLRVNTGIIAVEQERETLRFIHLTFCEFMAAHYISHYVVDGIRELYELQQRFNRLDNPVTRSRLNQVIPFALGLMGRSRPVDQPNALSTMERIVSDDVLAAIFLETKAYAHPAWGRFYGRVMQLLAELAASPDPGDIAADMHVLTAFVRKGFEQPAFTLFALDQLRKDKNVAGLWISLAIEAGLAFSAANQIFRHSDVPVKLEDASAPAKRQSWTRHLGHNLLGWLFDQAYYNTLVRETMIVHIIRDLPKPSTIGLLIRFARIGQNYLFKRSRFLLYFYTIGFAIIGLTSQYYVDKYVALPADDVNFLTQNENGSQQRVTVSTFLGEIIRRNPELPNVFMHSAIIIGSITLILHLLFLWSSRFLDAVDKTLSYSVPVPPSDYHSDPLWFHISKPVNIYYKPERAMIALHREIHNIRLMDMNSAQPQKECSVNVRATRSLSPSDAGGGACVGSWESSERGTGGKEQ